MKSLMSFAILFFTVSMPFSVDAQCPDMLLWTNGSSLWAYRAVDCSGEFCRQPTDKVLCYSSQLEATGCTKNEDKCSCRAGEIEPIGAAAAIEADLPIQNRGCQNLDSFVVKIGEDHYQCVEFRFVPDQSKTDDFGQAVARNMRMSVKLTGKPEKGTSNLLVDDAAKVQGNGIVRMIGDTTVSYPMLTSGMQMLDKLVVREAPAPVPQAGSGTKGSDMKGSDMKGSDAKGSDMKGQILQRWQHQLLKELYFQ